MRWRQHKRYEGDRAVGVLDNLSEEVSETRRQVESLIKEQRRTGIISEQDRKAVATLRD